MDTREVRSLIEDHIEELDLNVAIEDPSLEIDVDGSESDFEMTEVSLTKPIVAPRTEDPLDISKTIHTRSGDQIKINVSKRPKCPNCGEIPTEPGQSSRLKGRCADCGSLRCSECESTCAVCDRMLCRYCTDGYPGRRGPLCSKHREDVLREEEFERNFKTWITQLEKQIEILEKQLQWHETKLDQQRLLEEMRYEMEIEKKEQELRREEIRNERAKIKLDEKKEKMKHLRETRKQQLEHEIEQRKQDIRKFEAEVDSQIRNRELDVKEYEAETDRYVEVKKSEIKEKEKQLDAMEKLMKLSKQERVQARKDWELILETAERLDELNAPQVDVKEKNSKYGDEPPVVIEAEEGEVFEPTGTGLSEY